MAQRENISGLLLIVFLIFSIHRTTFVEGFGVDRLSFNTYDQPLSPAIFKLREEIRRYKRQINGSTDFGNRATKTPSSTTTTTTPPSPPPGFFDKPSTTPSTTATITTTKATTISTKTIEAYTAAMEHLQKMQKAFQKMMEQARKFADRAKQKLPW